MCKYCDEEIGNSNHLGDGYIAIGKNPNGLLLDVQLFKDENSANIKFNCSKYICMSGYELTNY